jgi:hypothetical protein
MPKHPDQHDDSNPVNDANLWFVGMFPEAVKLFGPGFLQASYVDVDALPRCIPMELNEDAWASALSDHRLGHQVVYYTPENAWWFLDYRVDAFCVTSEAKLYALLSNFLIRCSQDCGSLVDIRPLVTDFRRPEILKRVIERAKALLAADVSFFSGERGHRRMVNGKIIEPTAKPSYELFVQKNLTKQPASAVTVTDAFHQYFTFCREQKMNPLTRQEFRSMVVEIVREEFGCGLRHDVVGKNGKQTEGWVGLGIRLRDQSTVGSN